MLNSVCPVAVAFSVEGMGFHVGDELLRGQPGSAGALGVTCLRLGGWIGCGFVWLLCGLFCWLQGRVDRGIRDNRDWRWCKLLLRRLYGFGRVCGWLRGGDVWPVCFGCWLRLRRIGDGRIWPIDHCSFLLWLFRLLGRGLFRLDGAFRFGSGCFWRWCCLQWQRCGFFDQFKCFMRHLRR